MKVYLTLFLLLVTPIAILSLDCYVCSGSLTSDCANSDPNSKATTTISTDNTEFATCFIYALKENNITSAMFSRGGIFNIGGSFCDFMAKDMPIDKCMTCTEDLCNIGPFSD